MKILIIANARYRGGTSGSDKIYESFQKHWPGCSFRVWSMLSIDYKPFVICYLHRIFVSCIMAIIEPHRYDLVYSASDFLPDSLPAFLYKVFHKTKWVAGFYLKAFRENRLHFFSQKLVKCLIDKFADMVIVTNPTMYDIFPSKKKTWINGGIDLMLAEITDKGKEYDAVFIGRIHPSKGIEELIKVWKLVHFKKSTMKLAVIGDGDLGLIYLREHLPPHKYNVTYFGYMDDARYAVYKKSRVVLYTTPQKYDHFSMSPVEAMACGCPMLHFKTDVIKQINPGGAVECHDENDMADKIIEYSTAGTGKIKHEARRWAAQYDYRNQAYRVYIDVRKELYENSSHGKQGDGRHGIGKRIRKGTLPINPATA